MRRGARQPLWRAATTQAVPSREPHRCCHLCRGANNSRQAIGGSRCKTQIVYSSALLRRGATMPSRHGIGPYANWRHEICYQKRSQVAACESTARIASVSFPHGLASQTQLRPASCMASCGDAINNCGSQCVSPSAVIHYASHRSWIINWVHVNPAAPSTPLPHLWVPAVSFLPRKALPQIRRR